MIETKSVIEGSASDLLVEPKHAMTTYHKIQTIFKRDQASKHKTLLEGDFSLPEFAYLANNSWTFTEKVDGMNIRVIFRDGAIGFGGRSDEAQMPESLMARLEARFLPLAGRMAELFPGGDGVLYGEGYGAGIRKIGCKYRPDQDFVLFDVRVGPWWLQRADVADVGAKLGLDVVPDLGEGTLYDAVERARAGFSSAWGDFEGEGIVARPKVELMTRGGHRIIAKIKCRDFVG